MIFNNRNAYQQLIEEKIQIRDTFISSINFTLQDDECDITLQLISKYNKITVKFENVVKYEFSVFFDDPDYLENFKLVYLDIVQLYYFSMDPDYSFNYPIDSDCNNITFKNLIVVVSDLSET